MYDNGLDKLGSCRVVLACLHFPQINSIVLCKNKHLLFMHSWCLELGNIYSRAVPVVGPQLLCSVPHVLLFCDSPPFYYIEQITHTPKVSPT